MIFQLTIFELTMPTGAYFMPLFGFIMCYVVFYYEEKLCDKNQPNHVRKLVLSILKSVLIKFILLGILYGIGVLITNESFLSRHSPFDIFMVWISCSMVAIVFRAYDAIWAGVEF